MRSVGSRKEAGISRRHRVLAYLEKFLSVGPDQGETQKWEMGPLPPRMPHKTSLAKQMAQHIFKPLLTQ